MPRNYILKTIMFLAVLGTLVQSVGCFGSFLIDIIVENKTDQVLTVFVASSKSAGTVAPGQQTVENQIPMSTGKYLIAAKNPEGKTVFSETYTFNPDDKYHLIETNLKHKGAVKVYKAVILPFKTSPEVMTTP